jgi:hypothetical protein
MIKSRLVLPVLAAAAALLILAGCGGDSGPSSDPASIAPPDALLFAEVDLKPTGALKKNVEAIASKVGIADPGGRIVEELEKSAREDGEPIDFEKDVEPWLGETAAVFSTESGSDQASVAVQVADADAAQAFIDEKLRTDAGKEPKDASYEGVDYKLDEGSEEAEAAGIVGEFFVFGSEREFQAAVDASDGDSLADSDKYTSIASADADGSLADVYVDVGRLIEESGESGLDPEAKKIFEAAGLDLEEATAVASLVPGSDRVEIDVASNAGDAEAAPPASELLGSLPAGSAVALAGSDFGKSIGEVIDILDEEGIPGEVPPNQLKSTLKQAGIDLDEIAASLQDIGFFAEGDSESNLGGAIVLTTDDEAAAADIVSSVGFLVRAGDVPGVTAVSGRATGFSIGNVLGEKPLVVAAKGKRIAIGYGLPATLRGLTSESGPTIAGEPAYGEAVDALGGSGISGFADGDAALRFAAAVVPADDRAGFEEARPYLEKISWVAIGSGTDGDLATTKLIVALAK